MLQVHIAMRYTFEEDIAESEKTALFLIARIGSDPRTVSALHSLRRAGRLPTVMAEHLMPTLHLSRAQSIEGTQGSRSRALVGEAATANNTTPVEGDPQGYTRSDSG